MFIIILLIIIIIIFLLITFPAFFINLNKIDKNLKIPQSLLFHPKPTYFNHLAIKIKQLKPLWISQSLGGVMYTLGKASYLNGKKSQDIYNYNNLFLMNHFKFLYVDLLNFLKKYFKTPNVKYKTDAFLPGFHIFPSTPFIQYPVTSFHVDRQYNNTCWDNYTNCDFENTITFTIPIESPQSGGGIYFFEATKKDSFFKALISNKMKHEYKIGEIVLHTGNNWHLITPSKINKNEHRITLQGHAIKCNDTWYIYW